MLVEFRFDNPSSLTLGAMSRMLVDLDGLFFFAVALTNQSLLDVLNQEPFGDFEYDRLIYLSANFDPADPKYPRANFYSKVILESVSYSSPPTVRISLTASLDCQKVVKHILDFVKYILTLRQQKQFLEAAAYKERQEGLSREIANAREVAAILGSITDQELKRQLQTALVKRIEPLTSGQDYPRLDTLTVLRSPGP